MTNVTATATVTVTAAAAATQIEAWVARREFGGHAQHPRGDRARAALSALVVALRRDGRVDDARRVAAWRESMFGGTAGYPASSAVAIARKLRELA